MGNVLYTSYVIKIELYVDPHIIVSQNFNNLIVNIFASSFSDLPIVSAKMYVQR